jgi:hypothetical protein
VSQLIAFSDEEWKSVASVIESVGNCSVIQAESWVEFFPVMLLDFEHGDRVHPPGERRAATLDDFRGYLEAQMNSLFAPGSRPHRAPTKYVHAPAIRRIEKYSTAIAAEFVSIGIADDPSVAAILEQLKSFLSAVQPPPVKRGRPGRDERWVAYVDLLLCLWADPLERAVTVSPNSGLMRFTRAATAPLRFMNPSEEGTVKLLQDLVKARRLGLPRSKLLRRLNSLQRQLSAKHGWKKRTAA